jgi:FAD/FMN-containing dehydrogenase
MDRRTFLKTGAAASVVPQISASQSAREIQWDRLAAVVGDRLRVVDWPLAACKFGGDACDVFFKEAQNPYFLGDHPGLAQSFGWQDAWTLRPSLRVVAAESANDVAAAISFAAENELRLVVKGGGHSYHGDSNAADSLLLWTRAMDSIEIHDAFVPEGGKDPAMPAVSIGAGAMWGDVYRNVAVNGGRYVQGGGCLTVGVAGLVVNGGFGSFSPRFGLAASNLIEAEVVTADGVTRTVNAAQDPDLFFALKGGGGSFGVVTRLTLRTHPLPETVGLVAFEVAAVNADAYRELIEWFLSHYRDHLMGPAWGEQAVFRPDDRLLIAMLFSGMSQQEAEAAWAPFFDMIARSARLRLKGEPTVVALPGRSFWDPSVLGAMPGVVMFDNRPGASPDRIYWAGNADEAGKVTHAFGSAWLPATALDDPTDLADAVFAASRHWQMSLHFNKGLAGASDEVREAARRTAVNPAVADAFALAICGAEGPPAFQGVSGHEPDRLRGQAEAMRVHAALDELKSRVRITGSYAPESNYFLENWKEAYWGANAGRLASIKSRYDPDGLLVVHNGVVSA